MAAKAATPLIEPEAAVVSLQNGVRNDDILRNVLGKREVMGGAWYIVAQIVEPGVIRHSGTMQRLAFGEYDGKRSARAEAFLAACQQTGIEAEVSHTIRRTIWEKLVFLVGLSGLTTCIRKPIGPIRSNPRALLHDAMREVVVVGRAQGAQLAENFADDRLAFGDSLPATMTFSMRNDLERGSRLEVDGLSGDVVDRGRAAGVPTPVNRAIYDILILHAACQAQALRESGSSCPVGSQHAGRGTDGAAARHECAND